MRTFNKNYLYELPEDIQCLIYKKVYQYSLTTICDMREVMDDFNALIAYIKDTENNKNHAIWSIILRTDVGDPYYKYFRYYADYKTDFLQLNKSKMIRYDIAYSTIKYIEFTIYPIQDRIPTVNYNYIKNILEQYIHIFISLYPYYCNNDPYKEQYKNIKDVKLLNSKIIIEYADAYVFKCYIDIYKNILNSYNFMVRILNILTIVNNNNIFPEFNLDFLNDIQDLQEWFEYNTYFSGFTINEKGDTIAPFFSS